MDNNLHSLLGMQLPEDCRVTAVDGPMRSTPAKSKYGACFPPPAQPRATPITPHAFVAAVGVGWQTAEFLTCQALLYSDIFNFSYPSPPGGSRRPRIQ